MLDCIHLSWDFPLGPRWAVPGFTNPTLGIKVSLAHSAMNYWAWASGVCSVCFISDSPSSLMFVCCDTWQNGYATTVTQSFILIFMEVLSTSQLNGQGIQRKIKSEHASGWIYAMSNTGCNSRSIQVLPLLCPQLYVEQCLLSEYLISVLK